MVLSSTTTLLTFCALGNSYIVSSSACSMIERRPRAPVLRLSAFLAIAVSAAGRWPELPDVQTMEEAGYKDFVFAVDCVLLAPAKTPPENVKWLETETLKVLSTPDMKDKLFKSGFLVRPQGAAAAWARVTKEIEYLNAFKEEVSVTTAATTKLDKDGYFIEPTVIKASKPDYRTMCEEIFGPVLTLHTYPDKKWTEILKDCDRTSPYALTGAVFAQNATQTQNNMSASVLQDPSDSNVAAQLALNERFASDAMPSAIEGETRARLVHLLRAGS